MALIGYTMMCEQAGPKELVRDVEAAEGAGFDFAVISDHYFPWVDAMGHSPYAWAVLGAAAHATSTIDLMTYVTCPIKRYHPAVVAQKAATVALMADGRFTLGLGAGENLNEHVVGGGWPPVNTRHEMLGEAVDIIRALWEGGYSPFTVAISKWTPLESGIDPKALRPSASLCREVNRANWLAPRRTS